MLTAIAAILLTWAVLSLAFVGIGRVIWKKLGPVEAINGFDWLVTFWLGYAATLCFLQIWNFWWAINGYPLLLVCLIGLGCALLDARAILEFVTSRNPRVLIAMAIIAIWIADRALGPGNADDSGNYHYTVIRWANEYPAIPGLANLSAVYTYNNASLLYAAMLNTGPWAGRGEHVTNGLLVIALFAHVVPAIFRLRRGPRANPGDIFDLVLLTPAIMLTLAKDLPSPKTDLPPGVMTLVMARIALAFFLTATSEAPARRRRWIIILAIFAVALVALKLSAGLVAILLLLIPAAHWLMIERPDRRAMLRTAIVSIVVGLMLVGPWMARNVILNGYPLYPSKVMPLPVDWRVSGHVVDLVRDNVGKQSKAGMLFWLTDTLERNHLPRYARLVKPTFTKDQNPPGWSWVRPWFFSLPISSLIEIVMPMGICAAALILALRSRRAHAPSPPYSGERAGVRGRLDDARGLGERGTPHPQPLSPEYRGEGGRSFIWLSLAPLAGVLFWFTTAPDPRFGWAPMWTLAAILMAWAYVRSGAIESRRAVIAAVVVGMMLIVPTLAYRLVVLHIQKQVQPLRQVPIQFPGPDHGFWPHPTIPFKKVTNRWGLTLNMPADEHDAMTWGGPLPSAGWNWPPNDPDLRLRTPGDISAGFVSDHHSSP